MEKNELTQLLRSYNWWMGISTIAVAIGIFGEYVAHFVFEKKLRKGEIITTVVFGVFVFGGVVGEYVFGEKLSQTAERLQQLSEGEVSRANERASKADERASKNEKDAEQLRKDAEELKATLVWRHLNAKDNAAFADLNRFNDTPMTVWYNAGDAEGGSFAWGVATMVHDHKWRVTSPASILDFAIPGQPFGSVRKPSLGIEVVGSDNERSRDVAKAVAGYFVAHGFDATVSPRYETVKIPLVRIEVGTRPQGPQGEAKLKQEAEKRKNASSQAARP